MTLIAIVHLPKGETSLNRIAEKMGTTKQNVKQLVSAMVKKSFVRIVPSKMDKRACNVEISEKGMAVFEECNSRGIKFLSELFYNFSENELENLWQMLKKLYCFDGKEQSGFEETAVEELFNIQIPANILNKYRKE
jgi:DNA-binding MarR family transcriptional regulator